MAFRSAGTLDTSKALLSATPKTVSINLKHRFQLRDGTVVEGAHIGAWDTLENLQRYTELGFDGARKHFGDKWMEVHCNWTTIGEGVWIPAMNCRIPITDVLDLHVPFDRENHEIKVGDTIIYAMRDLTVSKMVVGKIVVKNNICTLHGKDVFTDKSTRNSYPKRCLKV